MALKTDYLDDILNADINTRRKYNIIQNDDGTVSFEDVTEYSQVGTVFGAEQVNEITREVNRSKNELDEKISKNDIVDNLLSTATDLPLSAKQGNELKKEVDLSVKSFTSIYEDVASGGRAYFTSPDGGVGFYFKCGIMVVHASADMLEYYAVILVTFINNGTNAHAFNILQETKFNAEFHYDHLETGMSIVNDNDKTVHIKANFIQLI